MGNPKKSNKRVVKNARIRRVGDMTRMKEQTCHDFCRHGICMVSNPQHIKQCIEITF